jgi:hypothetical protein
VVDSEGLRDLKEPDQLEPVQPLGARLIGVDARKAATDGRVGTDEAVDVGEAEEAANAMHHGVHRGVPQPGLVKCVFAP